MMPALVLVPLGTLLLSPPVHPAPASPPGRPDHGSLRVVEPLGTTSIVCHIRVLRADPQVDPGSTRPVERSIDREMVVRSTCAEREPE